jgi:hypothetical protein
MPPWSDPLRPGFETRSPHLCLCRIHLERDVWPAHTPPMRLHDPSVKVWTLILSKILDKTMRRTYKLVCTRSTKFPRLKQRFLRDWGNQWPMRRESSAWASLWRMNPPFGHTTLPKQAPRALCENLLHGRGSRLLHWRPSIRILEPNSASPRRVAGSAV